jgi:hypothetical protein
VRLIARDVDFLLGDLCVTLGFCLSPDVQAEFVARPPEDVDTFAEAVFRAEGLDPVTGDRRLYGQVRSLVARAFVRAEERDVINRQNG